MGFTSLLRERCFNDTGISGLRMKGEDGINEIIKGVKLSFFGGNV